jgi:large subunit ribosomal protein L4
VSEALEVLAYAADGTLRPHAVRLPADPFDGEVHEAVLHQAVTTFLANQRQGTAQTKTRSFVTGGNQKPWRHKGTGRARQGSIRSPLWPGGGTIFGPIPRDYRRGIPRKVRRLARRSALNARARERAISVIAPLAFEEPKTRRVAELLGRLGIEDRRVLLLTEALNPNLLLSARNLQNVSVMRYQDASAYDILRADALVIEEPALGALEPGGEASAIAPEPAPRAERPKREAVPQADARAERKPPTRKPVGGKKAPPARAAKAARAHEPARKPAAKKPAPKPKASARPKKGKSGKKPGKKE